MKKYNTNLFGQKLNVSQAIDSNAEGKGTITRNIGENANGTFNVSNTGSEDSKKTIHSIGIGTKDSDRSNALEIMQNGDIYLYGVGGYEGDNASDSKSIQSVIQDSQSGGDYTLPIASADTLGGIKVGEGLNIDGEGVLSSTGSGVGKIDPESDGTGEVFNNYNNNRATGQYSHAEGNIELQQTNTFVYLLSTENFQNKLEFDVSFATLNESSLVDIYYVPEIGDKIQIQDDQQSFCTITNIIDTGEKQTFDLSDTGIGVIECKKYTLTLDKYVSGEITQLENNIFASLGNLITKLYYPIKSNGTCSHSEGGSSISYGDYSHSEGGTVMQNCIVTITKIDNNKLYGDFSILYDYINKKYITNTNLSIIINHKDQFYTRIINVYEDDGYISLNEKIDTIEQGDRICIYYYFNIAYGKCSHSEGDGTIAVGDFSHSEGQYTVSSGNCAHSEGYKTISGGSYTHSEGFGTECYGASSHSEGNFTVSYNGSHAEGDHTTASNSGSHAEGYYTKTGGNYSHAEGGHTTTENYYEHAQGIYNVSNTSKFDYDMTIHSVGIGTSEDDRKNAHEIMKNGDHYIYGIGGYDGANYSEAQTLQEVVNSLSSGSGGGVGKVDETSDGTGEIFNTYDGEEKNIASGAYSHAEGSGTTASGRYSHAEGYMTTASGDYGSHTEGRGTKASGAYSHSEGYNTTANNDYEHAQGAYNKSNTGDSNSDKTIHSIGIGTTIQSTKNAVEIMTNGDQYVYGIGSYDGTNYSSAQTLQEVISNIQNTIWIGTQTQYDQLESKNENTLYFITE